MFEQPLELRGAPGVNAPDDSLGLISVHELAADRAMVGNSKLALGIHRFGWTDNLGNHVPRPLDDHANSFANPLAADVLLIVEGGLENPDAANDHRLQFRVRSERACAPHVHSDLLELRHHLLGGELVGGGPPGLPSNIAQSLLVGGVVDLDHEAVGVEIERLAFIQGPSIGLPNLVEIPGSNVPGIRFEAPSGEGLEPLPV